MKILAIETSCDETAIAIAEFFGQKSRPQIRVLSNIVSSQVKLHAKYGGVVPNLAKREHQRNLVPLLFNTLKESGFYFSNGAEQSRETPPKKNSQQARLIKNLEKILERERDLLKQLKKRVLPLAPPKIDAIAVTYGPGLAPALWTGVNFAKALAYLWDKPLIPVNHMAGHIYSAFLQKNEMDSRFEIRNAKFPALALLVSGGHTELVLMRGHKRFKIIGETLDDAAGEAFDKVARILGLDYPGGPEISREAEGGHRIQNTKIKLPRPMLNSKDYNFSFSGLKTAVLYLVRDLEKKTSKKTSFLTKIRPQIAKEFQNAAVEVLIKKTVRAAKEYKVKTVLLGGGVAANKTLRDEFERALKKELPETGYWMPEASLAGDNALMIALAAHFKWTGLAPRRRAAFFTGKSVVPAKLQANANLKLYYRPKRVGF